MPSDTVPQWRRLQDATSRWLFSLLQRLGLQIAGLKTMAVDTLKSFGAGLAGAIAVNAVHEGVRHAAGGNPSTFKLPRLDRLGQDGLVHAAHAVGLSAPRKGAPRYVAALASDLFINTALYGLVAKLTGKPLLACVVAAISAGVAGILMPQLIGLGDRTGTTVRAKSITFADYAVGGIVTGVALHLLSRRKS